MKVGDLVKRDFVTQDQKRRFERLNGTQTIGIIVGLNEDMVAVLFVGQTERVVVSSQYLSVVNEQERPGRRRSPNES